MKPSALSQLALPDKSGSDFYNGVVLKISIGLLICRFDWGIILNNYIAGD